MREFESGATIDWSPKAETAEPDGIEEVIAEHGLDPFNPEDREFALDILALRHYIDAHVQVWASDLDAQLDAFAGEGWREGSAPAPIPVLDSFELVHALIDDTAEWDPRAEEELRALLATT